MKLIMTLLIRNEEDIIRENILYHLNQGVDFIIAMDNNSTDDTIEILRGFESKGLLQLIHQKEDNYAQCQWVTEMARNAYRQYQADWVINSDADEFWWPVQGDLKTTLSNVHDDVAVLEITRFDFIPRSESEGSLFQRMIIRDNFSKNHLGRPLPPKVCHRGISDVKVAQGNHNLIFPVNIKVLKTESIEILHFPMRTYNQFANKIALGGAAYERNDILPKTVAMGWRRLFEEYKKGSLIEYYRSREISSLEIEQEMKGGRYTIDTRLRDYINEKCFL